MMPRDPFVDDATDVKMLETEFTGHRAKDGDPWPTRLWVLTFSAILLMVAVKLLWG